MIRAVAAEAWRLRLSLLFAAVLASAALLPPAHALEAVPGLAAIGLAGWEIILAIKRFVANRAEPARPLGEAQG